MSHFFVFGCKCFVHNNGKDNVDKYDAKLDDTLFIEYSFISKDFKVYNKKSLQI